MGRQARDNRDLPHPKPVERIELDGKNAKTRMILAVLLGVLGFGLIGYSLLRLLSSDSGWVIIEANTGSSASCAEELVFQYRLGAADMSPTAERKALTVLYSDLTVEAYRLFEIRQTYPDVVNPEYINRHVNEEIKVDPALYKAFETLLAGGSRALYMQPLYAQSWSLGVCSEDWEAENFDPYYNQDLRQEIQEYLSYVNDPKQVDLKLLGDNTIKLEMSAEFKDYLEEQWGVGCLDFGWMKNAFVVDYIAEKLEERGFVNGNLSSYDGFARNMGNPGDTFGYNVFHRNQTTVGKVRILEFEGPVSLVTYRDYPMDSMDKGHYYEYKDGTIRNPYLDSSDGLCKNASDTMVVYGKFTCGELLAQTMHCYIAEEMAQDKLEQLELRGIHSLYFTGDRLWCGDKNAKMKVVNQ